MTMKRKRKTSNEDNVNDKQRTVCESSNQTEIQEVCERRRLEISELIAEENRLNSTSKKKQRLRSLSRERVPKIQSDNDISDDCSGTDINNFQKFLEKEKQRTVQELQVVSRKRLKHALDILKGNSKKPVKNLTNEEKRLKILNKHCNINSWNPVTNSEHDHSWESSMYLVKNIRYCILTHNWNNLTHLLLMLFKHRASYVPFIKRVALLNFLCNPEDCNRDILNEFFELLTSPKIAKTDE